MMDFLSNKLAPFGEKVAAQRHLKALREGVLMAMPLVLIGSIFTLIGSFPIEAWTKWLHTHGELDALLSTMANNSFGLIGLATAFGISYRLAESYKTDGPSAGVLAIGAFLLVTPPIASKEGANGIPYGLIGGKGLFTAIVIAFITAEIYRQFIQRKFTIKMPKSVPEAVGHSFAALVPGTVIIVLFAIVTKVLQVTGIGSLNNLLAIIVGTPLALIGATLPGTFVAVLLNSVFWFCGVNGGQVVGSVMNPIWLQQADANRIALQAGHALHHCTVHGFVRVHGWRRSNNRSCALPSLLLKEPRIQNIGSHFRHTSIVQHQHCYPLQLPNRSQSYYDLPIHLYAYHQCCSNIRRYGNRISSLHHWCRTTMDDSTNHRRIPCYRKLARCCITSTACSTILYNLLPILQGSRRSSF